MKPKNKKLDEHQNNIFQAETKDSPQSFGFDDNQRKHGHQELRYHEKRYGRSKPGGVRLFSLSQNKGSDGYVQCLYPNSPTVLP